MVIIMTDKELRDLSQMVYTREKAIEDGVLIKVPHVEFNDEPYETVFTQGLMDAVNEAVSINESNEDFKSQLIQNISLRGLLALQGKDSPEDNDNHKMREFSYSNEFHPIPRIWVFFKKSEGITFMLPEDY